MHEEDYIPVEEAAAILGVSVRQASRYGAKVRTKAAGRRVLYHRLDVEAQARSKREQDEARTAALAYPRPPKQPKLTLMEQTAFLSYLRERDAQLAQLHEQLYQASHRIGELEAMLRERLPPEEERILRQRLAEAEAERTVLRRAIERRNYEE